LSIEAGVKWLPPFFIVSPQKKYRHAGARGGRFINTNNVDREVLQNRYFYLNVPS